MSEFVTEGWLAAKDKLQFNRFGAKQLKMPILRRLANVD
jgi:hypothetical protein